MQFVSIMHRYKLYNLVSVNNFITLQYLNLTLIFTLQKFIQIYIIFIALNKFHICGSIHWNIPDWSNTKWKLQYRIVINVFQNVNYIYWRQIVNSVNPLSANRVYTRFLSYIFPLQTMGFKMAIFVSFRLKFHRYKYFSPTWSCGSR